jgi:DNA-binding transcriptional MerR regulator
MASAATRPQAVEIPNKLYFRIGDVSRLTGIPAYVLRYWETEFSQIAPKKSGTNQRLYRRKDVEHVLEIKRLLYEKRFTIEGARQALHERGKTPKAPPIEPRAQTNLFPGSSPEAGQLAAVRQELKEILALLS